MKDRHFVSQVIRLTLINSPCIEKKSNLIVFLLIRNHVKGYFKHHLNLMIFLHHIIDLCVHYDMTPWNSIWLDSIKKWTKIIKLHAFSKSAPPRIVFEAYRGIFMETFCRQCIKLINYVLKNCVNRDFVDTYMTSILGIFLRIFKELKN